MYQSQEEFMQAAIQEALKAREMGDHAVGAVVTREGDYWERWPENKKR